LFIAILINAIFFISHADSDGRCGWIQQRGFLACSDSEIRLSVLDVLDGGEAVIIAIVQKLWRYRNVLHNKGMKSL